MPNGSWRSLAALAGGLALAASAARAGEGLVDPTAPPVSAAEPEVPDTAPRAALQLQSVLISGERRIAVIDGQRVQVGDFVAGFEVAEIEPTAVWLDGAAGALRLALRAQSVKEPSRSWETWQ